MMQPASVTFVLNDPQRQFTATKLTTTSTTTVLLAGPDYPVIEAIRIVNTDTTNTCTALVQLYDAETATTYTLYTTKTPIPAGDVLNLTIEAGNLVPIVMRPTWEIRVTAQAINRLEVMVSARSGTGRLT